VHWLLAAGTICSQFRQLSCLPASAKGVLREQPPSGDVESPQQERRRLLGGQLEFCAARAALPSTSIFLWMRRAVQRLVEGFSCLAMPAV
jgi:hypothetical protein